MVGIIGAHGFVGSAFIRYLQKLGIPIIPITLENYAQLAGTKLDIVINCSCNSKKFLADRDPVAEFDASVTQVMRVLHDYPSRLHVHISSVDVYSDLTSVATTTEETVPDYNLVSNYGFHKYLAERCVCRHASNWLIIRLAGMVGPGLVKNPVYDITHGQPLRIHPESQYQFMSTEAVAQAVWQLVNSHQNKETFNVCGRGLISPRGIAAMAGKILDLNLITADQVPRIVDINVEKVSRFITLPETRATVTDFVSQLSIGVSG